MVAHLLHVGGVGNPAFQSALHGLGTFHQHFHVQIAVSVDHVEERHHGQVLVVLAVDPVEHLLEGAHRQVGGDDRDKQVIHRGKDTFRHRTQGGRAVQNHQFVAFPQRGNQLFQAVFGAAVLEQLDIRIAHGQVGGDCIQVGPAGFPFQAANGLLALDQVGGLVAIAIVHPQVKAGGPLRVQVPEQGAVFPAGSVPGHIDCGGGFTYAPFQVVKGNGLHGVPFL